MDKLMKQAILTENGFEIRETPMPNCGRDHVLVQTRANGLCASDLGAYKDKQSRVAKELYLGHEASGEVVAVGSNVTAFRTGDQVTALGGYFAEYNLFVPADLVLLPENIKPIWALGEPVACCVHAMNRCKIKAGQYDPTTL